MRFSIYSEIQQHPNQTPEQLYAEVLEQIVNADRLGYDTYAADRALLLPEVLDLVEPDGLLRSRRTEDARDHVPHDAARPAVPQPPGAGLRDRRDRHPHGRPLRVRRRARARLDPAQGRSAARRGGAPALRGGGRSALQGARRRALLAPRDVLRRRRLARPSRSRSASSASTSAAPRTAPTSSPRRTAGASPCRRCCRTPRCPAARPLPRRNAPSTARPPTSSGSTPATSTTIATPRCARPAIG